PPHAAPLVAGQHEEHGQVPQPTTDQGRDHAMDPALLDGAEVAVRVAGQPRPGIARHRSVGRPRHRPASARREIVARGDVHPPDLLEIVRADLADVWLAHGVTSSQRVGADDLPAVALAELLALIVVHRAGTIQELLDVAAGGGRSVEEDDSAGLLAGVLPRVGNVAREKRAGAGAADPHLVADLNGELAGEDPGDLVAVAMEMEET